MTATGTIEIDGGRQFHSPVAMSPTKDATDAIAIQGIGAGLVDWNAPGQASGRFIYKKNGRVRFGWIEIRLCGAHTFEFIVFNKIGGEQEIILQGQINF